MSGLPFLIFDTETSSLFDFKKPADAPGQARLAAITMLRVDPDLTVESKYEALVKPEGWELHPDAAAVNKLTMERLHAEGVPVAEVLDLYEAAVRAEGRAVAAFGAQFDTKVMRGELRRAGRDDMFQITRNVCVMRSLLGVCRIPSGRGKGIKFPKLTEAMAHFKLPFPEAHTAAGDAWACLALLRKMKEIGVFPEPEVHFAKERPEPAASLPLAEPAPLDTVSRPVHTPLHHQEIPE